MYSKWVIHARRLPTQGLNLQNGQEQPGGADSPELNAKEITAWKRDIPRAGADLARVHAERDHSGATVADRNSSSLLPLQWLQNPQGTKEKAAGWTGGGVKQVNDQVYMNF